jgi:hypothetical protein
MFRIHDTSRPYRKGDTTAGLLQAFGYIVLFVVIVKNCSGV